MKSLRERKEKPISMMTDVKINAEACINAEYKINANERIDDLCRDNLKLIQNTDVFCFGMDAVLLQKQERMIKCWILVQGMV